jgi:hypothetical protein
LFVNSILHIELHIFTSLHQNPCVWEIAEVQTSWEGCWFSFVWDRYSSFLRCHIFLCSYLWFLLSRSQSLDLSDVHFKSFGCATTECISLSAQFLVNTKLHIPAKSKNHKFCTGQFFAPVFLKSLILSFDLLISL